MKLDLTEDELLRYGQLCEGLLDGDDTFSSLVDRFKLEQFQDFLSTKPIEKREREKIYDAIDGVNMFYAMLMRVNDQYKQLQQLQLQTPSSDEDAAFIED